jgi:pectate disaccharide-lyase
MDSGQDAGDSAVDAGLKDALIVTRDGDPEAPGTLAEPTSLAAALERVTAGRTIYLRGGTYAFAEPVVLGRDNSGTAEAPKTLAQFQREAATLDFSEQPAGDLPGLSIEASYWQVAGLIVRGAAGAGIRVTGSHNRIERSASHGNRGAGFELTAGAEANRSEWPSANVVVNCESFDNGEGAAEAAGFSADRAGDGNEFRGCVAHHNLGDGWDFRSDAGEDPGAITIDQCVAHSNGTRTDGTHASNGQCSGFRLGSEMHTVAHVVARSVAYFNGAYGFTANGNAGETRAMNLLAYDNAKGNYGFAGAFAVFTNDVSLWQQADGAEDDAIGGEDVRGSNRFWSGGKSGVSASDFANALAAPRLPRKPSGDLELAAFALALDSPLIDAGVVPPGALPFDRSYYVRQPDLGAFELE